MRKKHDNIIKIQQSGKSGSYRITIPKYIMRELGWKEHQKLVITRRGKRISIIDWPALRRQA